MSLPQKSAKNAKKFCEISLCALRSFVAIKPLLNSAEATGMVDEEARWTKAWQRLELAPPPGLWAALEARYAEPHRAYHTLDHLAFCFGEYDRVAGQIQEPVALEFALWFHDAVYDTHRTDNELRSANWAVDALTESGVAPDLSQRVYNLIIATRHNAPPTDTDAAYLVDIDLAILGQPPQRFDQYDADIRREYGWVPEAEFCTKRAAILRSFLARARIYQTEPFFDWYEAQARQNLARAIGRLSGEKE
jgi:predicted metal-dependent HD superfamily phosphohydrolase